MSHRSDLIMSEKKQTKHIEPQKNLWLFEQANDQWMTWTGTEQELNEWIPGTGIKAYEYSLTGKETSG